MLGRASLVCQIFESHCRYVFRIADLASGFAAGRYTSLEAACEPDILNALDRDTLHRIVGRLARVSESAQHDLDTLLGAKEARNYFAHRAALPTFSTPAKSKELERVRKEAAALAEGFTLLARWVFEIEEKDFVPLHVRDGHADRIRRWILDPVMEFEGDSSAG